jgi:hypothetical protein
MRKACVTLAGLALFAVLLGWRFEADQMRASLAAFTDGSPGAGAELTVATWQTATLGPTYDAGTDATPGNEATNFGGDSTLAVEGPDRNGWLLFDLTGIPGGATVFSAELRLCDTGAVTQALTHSLAPADGAWTETGITANSAPGVVSDPPAVVVILTTTTQPTCFIADVTSHVEAWLDTGAPLANHGWRIAADTDDLPIAYAAREDANPDMRPQLVIEYVP